MGDRKRRKDAFLKAHPICCFCGGATPATTEDHVPCRAVFDQRVWPEGYSFPACENCNALTRHDENVLAFLTRINPGEKPLSDSQKSEMQRCMAAMHRTYPEAFLALRPSPNYVRGFLKERGIQRPPGAFLHDVPILQISRPEFVNPFRQFGIKLFCALHYKHWGRIVTHDETIAMRMLTNVQLQDGILTEDIFKMLNGRPKISRSKTGLEEQFDYIYAMSIEQTLAAYICKFRESFVLMGVVTSSGLPEQFDDDPDDGSFQGGPFKRSP